MSTAFHLSGLLRGIAVTTLTIALTACGGGSGGGSSTPLLPIALPTQPSQPEPSAPTQPEQPVPITYQVSMTPTAGEVTIGKTLQLAVSMVDSQGRSIASPPTVFTSSDAALATVANQDDAASTGVVTGVTVGPVQITAKVTAPDGRVLTQQASVTVVAAPLTYKLVLPNPTVNLQFNQPLTVTATVVASDGTDVTAAANGWHWASDDAAVVAVTPSGASASLLASNAQPQAATATITVRASAPNGSVVSGQIATTALPHYTYLTKLSASSVKVANDRTAIVTAKVIRSDGVDVTASMPTLSWQVLMPTSTTLAMTLSDNNTTATFTSTRPNLELGPADPPFSDPGFEMNAVVKAGDVSTYFRVTEVASYTSAVTGQLSGPISTSILFFGTLFHSSADGAPNVTSECRNWIYDLDTTAVPHGIHVSYGANWSNPDRTAFTVKVGVC